MPRLNFTTATVADFSGGQTDEYINGAPNRARTLRNFYVLPDRSILTRPGQRVENPEDEALPNAPARVNQLINYANDVKLFYISGNHLFIRDSLGAFEEVKSPLDNSLFSLADDESEVSFAQWNNHLLLCSGEYDKPQKVYRDDSGNFQLRTAGLPALATKPEVESSGGAGSDAYIYAFTYSYEYKVNDQTFLDESAVRQVQLIDVNDPPTHTVNITDIPELTGGNYDTANVKVKIYRTISGGQQFYLIGEIANGVTTYNDSASDDDIQEGQLLYTEGGVLDNEEPPLAKYVHVVGEVAFYANLKDGTEIRPAVYRQSFPFDPDSTNGLFEDELEDNIKGISSHRDLPLIFCDRYVYRVEGRFDEVGQGELIHTRVHESAGCLSNNSIVQTEIGVFWCGEDGIYFTDGYQCYKVTDHLDQTYRSITENMSFPERIKGTYDSQARRIYFTVQRQAFAEEENEENDSLFVLDVRWGLSREMSCYFWDGTSDFKPTSLAVYKNKLYRGDELGYVFLFEEGVLTDPRITQGVSATEWVSEPIIWDYTSVASNLGSELERKWITRILMSARNRTNVTMQLKAINDDGRVERDLTPIRWRRNFNWGNEEFVWADETCAWFYGGMIEQWRRMPARGMRASYIQVQFTNADAVIIGSDAFGTATVSQAGTTTVTLTDSQKEWLTDSVGYRISFDVDDYEGEYDVTGRTDTTLTISDPTSQIPEGTFRWMLKGIRKNEQLNLLSFTLSFSPMSSGTHPTFRAGDGGENAS